MNPKTVGTPEIDQILDLVKELMGPQFIPTPGMAPFQQIISNLKFVKSKFGQMQAHWSQMEKRSNDILDVLLGYSKIDFSNRAEVTDGDSSLNAIASGINMLGEELEYYITEHQKTEKKLTKSLNEKEVILREVYHRVKNNLQTISSLLSLQSRACKDEATQKIFTESQNRIRAMALVHENLYQTKNLAKISISKYFRGLVLNLFNVFRINTNKIDVDFDIENIMLGIDTAIPLGLIINEIVTNALKYAFDEKKPGSIKIALSRIDKHKFHLTVSDNGKGFPRDFDLQSSNSIGLTLIQLLSQQLEGEISIEHDNGTKYILILSELDYKERG